MRTFVAVRIVWRILVVGSWRVWVVVSADEAKEMASTNQFFNFVLECFTFVYSMAIVTVIATIFGHVSVGRIGCFARWWDEVGLKSFIKKAGSRNTQEGVFGEARLAGFLGSRIRP